MEIEELRTSALENIRDLIDELAASEEKKDQKKAELLSYWISDYARLIRQEKSFSPSSRMKYKKGQIVKAHLGFRIGNEEGGLHYGIVLDRNNSVRAGTLTIVPLTSLKQGKQVHWTSVPLGEEIYNLLSEKLKQYQLDLEAKNAELDQRFIKVKSQLESEGQLSPERISKIDTELIAIKEMIEKGVAKIAALTKVKRELSKMKRGSIALVSQIVTISKLRIYDPISSEDSLGSVRVSNETLDQIDERVSQLFLGDPSRKEGNF